MSLLDNRKRELDLIISSLMREINGWSDSKNYFADFDRYVFEVIKRGKELEKCRQELDAINAEKNSIIAHHEMIKEREEGEFKKSTTVK